MTESKDRKVNETNPKPTRDRIVQTATAAMLSLFIPGAGQFYNRQWVKAFVFAVGSFVLWFVLLGWVVSLWAVVDAGMIRWYRTGGEELRYLKSPRALCAAVAAYAVLLALMWVYGRAVLGL
jgi:TM2 domain-containing membrane protein YozV